MESREEKRIPGKNIVENIHIHTVSECIHVRGRLCHRYADEEEIRG